ncbi:uncharacterized protein LOC117167217 isoform X2 [Belonocnema kinseyi]|uniref:uncharacterized protein LOC117167217 isoform X2 n=1 Tax=Belonocnema kinseyi TaxID=2817044 RepID=UPI00143DBC44|nr:uncharacterized protein LOC117167217 isoform X2 [Belonocnema kinseyi]XP_033207872.1 uncharacterized protein LOC117167217 isoform X2 [Belonocnema kinseyi]
MAISLPPIEPFKLGENPFDSWRDWKHGFLDYLLILKFEEEPERTKLALFRHVGGNELKLIYRKWQENGYLSTDNDYCLTTILAKFDQHFLGYEESNDFYDERRHI